MTGPTWTCVSRGSPTKSSRAAPAIIAIILSATSSWTQRSRSAEQRCPAERKAEARTSSQTCSGKAVASTIIVLIPPVSAINTGIGPSFAANPRLIFVGGFHRARESHPRDSGQGDKLLAKLAVPRQEMQCRAGHASAMQKRDGDGGDQGGLLGGFSEDAVSSGKRRGHLAEKDRQRKVPRADADEHTSPMTI